MSPFDEYGDDTAVVFTFGGDSAGVWIFVILAVLLFIGFFAAMIRHENHAYRAVMEHTEVERGPAVEGEPPAY